MRNQAVSQWFEFACALLSAFTLSMSPTTLVLMSWTLTPGMAVLSTTPLRELPWRQSSLCSAKAFVPRENRSFRRCIQDQNLL